MCAIKGFRIYLLAVVMFLLNSAVSASSIYTAPAVPNPPVFIMEPDVYGCFIGFPCPPQSWTQVTLPLLVPGDTVSISTVSIRSRFFLGDSLSGSYLVGLTPVFHDDTIYFVDELHAFVADAEQILGVTTFGEKSFVAELGRPYYLLMGGVVRDNVTYELYGAWEVIFINGKADWITVTALQGKPYNADTLKRIGLPSVVPTFIGTSNMRWHGLGGLLEVSMFQAGNVVDYVYIKAKTP